MASPRHPPAWQQALVKTVLGPLISLGLAFLVRRLVESRERRRALAAGRKPMRHAAALAPLPAILARAPEPQPLPTVAPAMTDKTQPPSRGDQSRAVQYPLLGSPHVVLSGPVDQGMYASFRDQLSRAPGDGTLVVSISTLGGDPEVARLMGDEIRLLHEYQGREILFLGKVAVYSAGATFMSAFPVDKRFLTKGTRIMVHERIINSTIQISGPLKTTIASLKAKLHEIEHSILIEEEGFRDLVAGSKIDFEEVRRRAPENWYIEAEEARELGLVLDVI